MTCTREEEDRIIYRHVPQDRLWRESSPHWLRPCGPVPFAVTPHTEHPPRAVTSTVIRWALKSHLFRCTFIKTFYRYILITGNLDVDLQAIACVHSLQYSTVQYSKALPPFRKRKQNTSTTKDSGLQQRQKKNRQFTYYSNHDDCQCYSATASQYNFDVQNFLTINVKNQQIERRRKISKCPSRGFQTTNSLWAPDVARYNYIFWRCSL